MYRNGDKNNWATKGAIAKIFDPCLSKVDHLSLAKTAQIQRLNYPMLTFFIENWGSTVYYDKKARAFLIRKFSLKSFTTPF